MSIHPVAKVRLGEKFKTLYPIFDECRRINHGYDQLVNISWTARSIQSALNTRINCENIYSTAVPASDLARLMDVTQIDRYKLYASQLSIYDCNNPLIVIFKGETPPEQINDKTCEILDGKARIVRALDEDIALPVILISQQTAITWGIPSQLRMLGAQDKYVGLDKSCRSHRQRSGQETLPIGSDAGNAVISDRVSSGRAASEGPVTNPFAYSMILSSDRRVRKHAHEKLRARELKPRGLIDAFPEVIKSGPPPRQYQEKCLLILLAKLLEAGCTLDDLNVPMRHILRLPFDQESIDCVHQRAKIQEKLKRYAKLARAALRKAPSPWDEPLSEKLLLFGATRVPLAEKKVSEKEQVLKQHKVELLQWTFYSLFRTKHWRIGRNLVERFNIKDDYFPEPDDDDPTTETRTVPRIHHADVNGGRIPGQRGGVKAGQ